MAAEPVFPYEIIFHILSFLDYPEHGHDPLYRCSLVNWQLNRAASKLLYESVTFHRTKQLNLMTLDLKDDGLPDQRSPWTSALLPHNSPFVKHLQVSGVLNMRHPPKNRLPEALQTAIKTFINLSSVRFTPDQCYEDTFTEALKLLCECPSLRSVHLGGSWLDEKRAPILTELKGLQKVTIISPSRAVLDLFPRLLGQLSDELVELHLLDNCGSITPGVLRAFLPSLQGIRSFSLGLSYSITDDDLFDAVNQLPCLEDLELFYYYQQRSPITAPTLPRLRSFAVTLKEHPTSPQMLESLSKWIRKFVSSSSIEQLLIREERWFLDHKVLNFDSLVYHLTAKHSSTLRVLNMQHMFISVKAQKALFAKCKELEVLCYTSGKTSLSQFKNLAHGLPKLHSVALYTEHVGKLLGSNVTDEGATEILRSAPSLRTVIIDGWSWQGHWTTDDAGDVKLEAKQYHRSHSRYPVYWKRRMLF
ncbi:hypothetical protein D9758_006577 [Tetrapyrgos nigripes]|uniref:F-box domain-containing protein n=1 Tax=Tetrapyrgos nigripes TaxID=182062 RepID=A0A8H5LQY1_9AGAR|nr:hypothetical protein D9758_006577 [Tetrapyrgos nigripes]